MIEIVNIFQFLHGLYIAIIIVVMMASGSSQVERAVHEANKTRRWRSRLHSS